MRAKPRERVEARRLQREGEPLKRIAAELGVSVNSVHRWTRDIKLTPEQRRHNLTGPRGPQNPEHIAKRVAAWRHKHRARRLEFQEEGKRRARAGDGLHIAGCMLYWAEGAKARNVLTFANSDPGMIRFFRTFLVETLGVDPMRIRIRLNVYTNNGRSLAEIEEYWLGLLGLPRSCLRGHTLNHHPTSSSGKKRNKLPHGVCTLSVARSTRELQQIFGAIQEYAGIDEPSWLDGPPRKKPVSKAGEKG